ncbi:hypothetical protein ACH4F6_15560 [Streptomyces sp. NPDC017936]|uniref:hypothetical protein n=1 Tax=Streptomyces sp. NPDC017936 TaxID=3365016 RepID=UPI00379F04F4
MSVPLVFGPAAWTASADGGTFDETVVAPALRVTPGSGSVMSVGPSGFLHRATTLDGPSGPEWTGVDGSTRKLVGLEPRDPEHYGAASDVVAVPPSGGTGDVQLRNMVTDETTTVTVPVGQRCNDVLVRLSTGALRLYEPACGAALKPTTPYTAQDTSDNLYRCIGRGNGTFGARVKLFTGWGGTCNAVVGVGDITGDGRADLVARDTAGVLYRLNGTGTGTFGARVKIGTGRQNYRDLSWRRTGERSIVRPRRASGDAAGPACRDGGSVEAPPPGRDGNIDVDKSQLTEMTARRAADGSDGRQFSADDISRILDLLFGTVEQAGTIAEALRAREAVTLGSFGSFQAADGVTTFRPGIALTEYLQDQTR